VASRGWLRQVRAVASPHVRISAVIAALLAVFSTTTCNGNEGTNPRQVTGPAVTDVVFTTEPPATVEGNVVINPPIQVATRDASGAPVPTATVTIIVGTSPWPAPGSRVLGTVTVKAVNGVATFDNLRVDKPGAGYTLTALSGAASHSSTVFNVKLTFTTLAAAGSHTCGVTIGGAYCWGWNRYGELGGATGANPLDSVPVLVANTVPFLQIAGGEDHTCALSLGGTVYCWGENSQGELGDGTTSGSDPCPGGASMVDRCRLTPAPVTGSGTPPVILRSLTSGFLDLHTCGLVTGGIAYCWGYNYAGELGDGTTTNRPAPVQVMGSGTEPLVLTSLASGGSQTCGVATDQAVYCWGFGSSSTPTQIAGSGASPLLFTSVTPGLHTCGLTTDGAVYCWGVNVHGELGDGTTTSGNTPVRVLGSGTAPLVFTMISAGDFHTCGVTAAGSAYCWGWDGYGQLGDGATTDQTTPVQVLGSGTAPLLFASVTGGEAYTCGLTHTGAAYCWGYNELASLGDGTRTSHSTPIRVIQ